MRTPAARGICGASSARGRARRGRARSLRPVQPVWHPWALRRGVTPSAALAILSRVLFDLGDIVLGDESGARADVPGSVLGLEPILGEARLELRVAAEDV